MRNTNKPRLLRRIIRKCYSYVTHSDFPYIWIIIFALFILSLICYYSYKDYWGFFRWAIVFAVIFITLIFVRFPMNAVYGLMGTRGSVKKFFINFIIISFFFATIYHWGFFHNAAVSYDVNQPHIYYNCNDKILREGRKDTTTVTLYNITKIDGIERQEIVNQMQVIEFKYQKITFGETLRNTIMTTLMQEPTDFFAIASTHNEAMDRKGLCLDKDKSAMFHWLIIIQILISWIFFGVFISILYNKFRYES